MLDGWPVGCSGIALDVGGVSVGCPVDVIGCSVVARWMSGGFVLDARRMFVGYSLDVR